MNYSTETWYTLYESWRGEKNDRWRRQLYHSHGYRALLALNGPDQPQRQLTLHPCNSEVLSLSLGAIVPSQHAANLFRTQVGRPATLGIGIVPLCRSARDLQSRETARRELGITPQEILVCSFEMVGESKFSLGIAEAWEEAMLNAGVPSRLVFVGENAVGSYGKNLSEILAKPYLQSRAKICGWIESSAYSNYLAACDIAVQLRAVSRGETSAAAPDCICTGIPTIVNNQGSQAEVSPDCVWRVPREPSHSSLVTALRTPGTNLKLRQSISEKAIALQSQFRPESLLASI